MRPSARATIAAVTAGVVLLPLAFLAVAVAYEGWLTGREEARLERVAAALAGQPKGAWAAAAAREGVWLRRVAPGGEVAEDAGPAASAQGFSAPGAAFEALAGLVGARTRVPSLEALDAELGPAAEREEVRSALAGAARSVTRAAPGGQSLLVGHARPLPAGGALWLVRANHRGVRQLVLVENQLVKLLALQLLVGLLVAAVLGRTLVGPLERLAAGARSYPARPLADPGLLARGDELGALARALDGLAQDLEARRALTVAQAGELAHELKNPLATIRAAAELMATTATPTPEKRAQLAATIEEAVARLQRTAEALVAEVRLETSLAEARREPVALVPWLEALLDGYRGDGRWEGWRFTLAAEPGVGEVALVPDAFARLVRNLVDNALVQPAARREVALRVRRRGEAAELEVVDFGPGVPEGNRELVFRRFFTVRPQGADPGTGLGLPVARSVARAHGGELTLLPAEPGQGAVFRVAWPASGRAAAPEPAATR